MTDDTTPTFTTPDGETGIALSWPAGGSQHFKIIRDMGADIDHVSVIPVLFPSGEVRLYARTESS